MVQWCKSARVRRSHILAPLPSPPTTEELEMRTGLHHWLGNSIRMYTNSDEECWLRLSTGHNVGRTGFLLVRNVSFK